MPKIIDLTGKRFGRLTAIKENGRTKSGSKLWLCQCDCGKTVTVSQGNLKIGQTVSCGCIMQKHGESRTRLYSIWRHIKTRCTNKNDKDYEYYGGKGICFCEEWNDYENFRDWAIANGYNDALTIDRINPDKDYEPSNCRWITAVENSARVTHIKSAHFLEVDGKVKNKTQWAKEIGATQAIISSWIRRFGESGAIERIKERLDNGG